MVLAALAGGKHVYDALPFAIDAQRARAMLDAQRHHQRVGVVDAQFRWVPAGMHMKSLIDEGFLGEPLGFNVQLLLPVYQYDGNRHPHAVWPEGGLTPYLWLADKSSGAGGWRNFGTHSTLFLTHVLGEVEAAAGVVATGLKSWQLPDGSELRPQTEDLGSAILRLKNGAIGNMQCGWSVPDAAGLRVEVWGDRGRLLLVDPTFGDGVSARLYAGDARKHSYGQEAGQWLDIPAALYDVPGTPLSKQNAYPYMVSMAWMFHHMLKSIESGSEGSPSFAEAYHAQCVVDAVAQSHQTQRWVRIDEVG
jgi:predicted dehydrogenase